MDENAQLPLEAGDPPPAKGIDQRARDFSTAVHEAAHAVAGCIEGEGMRCVEGALWMVSPEARAVALPNDPAGHCMTNLGHRFASNPKSLGTDELRTVVVESLAGAVASKVLLERTGSADSTTGEVCGDWKGIALALLYLDHPDPDNINTPEWALGKVRAAIYFVCGGTVQFISADKTTHQVAAMEPKYTAELMETLRGLPYFVTLAELTDETRKLVDENWATIEALAKLLLERRSLSGREVEQFVRYRDEKAITA